MDYIKLLRILKTGDPKRYYKILTDLELEEVNDE